MKKKRKNEKRYVQINTSQETIYKNRESMPNWKKITFNPTLRIKDLDCINNYVKWPNCNITRKIFINFEKTAFCKRNTIRKGKNSWYIKGREHNFTNWHDLKIMKNIFFVENKK